MEATQVDSTYNKSWWSRKIIIPNQGPSSRRKLQSQVEKQSCDGENEDSSADAVFGSFS